MRRNASLPSSESRSIVHLPMVQRRYVIALLLPFVARAGASGNQDNRSLQGGASSPDLLEEAAFSELLLYGVLGSSHQGSADGIMLGGGKSYHALRSKREARRC